MTGVGEISSLVAALCWAVGTCLFTAAGHGIPAIALNLFKGTLAVIFLVATVIIIAAPFPVDPRVFFWLAISGIVGIALGDTAFFIGLPRIGAQATSAGLCLSAPLTALAALVILGERLTGREVLGLGLTVIAVTMVLLSAAPAPHRGSVSSRDRLLGIAAAVASPLFHALGVVAARPVLAGTDPILATTIRVVPAVAVLALFMPWKRDASRVFSAMTESKRRAATLLAASFFAAVLGWAFMTIGVKYAKAGVSVALSSTFPIWVLPMARIGLGEKIGWNAIAGTLIAVAGVFFLVDI